MRSKIDQKICEYYVANRGEEIIQEGLDEE